MKLELNDVSNNFLRVHVIGGDQGWDTEVDVPIEDLQQPIIDKLTRMMDAADEHYGEDIYGPEWKTIMPKYNRDVSIMNIDLLKQNHVI